MQYTDSTLPVLNYNGNTYVPLKNFGSLCQKTVTWNTAQKRIDISQPFSYLDENDYSGDKQQMVHEINLAVKYFNEGKLDAFDALFTEKGGNGSYGVWAGYDAILALGHVSFDHLYTNDAAVTVWHVTVFKDEPDRIQENSTSFSFTKTAGGWKLVMLD